MNISRNMVDIFSMLGGLRFTSVQSSGETSKKKRKKAKVAKFTEAGELCQNKHKSSNKFDSEGNLCLPPELESYWNDNKEAPPVSEPKEGSKKRMISFSEDVKVHTY